MNFSARSAKVLIPLVVVAFASAMAPAMADSSNGDSHNSGVIYNSVITPLPGSLVSQPFEAQSVSEFGNAVNFSGGTSHTLSKVIVTMTSAACVSGHWYSKDCVTPADSTFSQPITLNIYFPSSDHGVSPGDLKTSVTQTFNIKYRPSASPLCVDASGNINGRWYDNSSKTCFKALAQNITFNLKNVKVGSSAIFGIAYNTTHYGYKPIGESTACFAIIKNCGYDSLNVALTEDPTDVSVGSSVVLGQPWLNSTCPGDCAYADRGVGGLGTFRMDTAAWGYVPAIKVYANGEGNSDNQSGEQSSNSKAPDKNTDGKSGIKKD